MSCSHHPGQEMEGTLLAIPEASMYPIPILDPFVSPKTTTPEDTGS